MKRAWNNRRGFEFRRGSESAVPLIPSQPCYGALKPVLLFMAMLCFLFLTAKKTPAQSSANPVSADAKYEELLRRVGILEERLRESEANRGDLSDEVQRLRSDLNAIRSEGSGGQGLKTITVQRGPQPEVTESAPALAEEAPYPEGPQAPGPVDGTTAGWDRGFYIRSKDGNFELRPIGILQVDFWGHETERQITTDDTLASTFDIRRLRLGFEGFVFRDIGYTLEANIDGQEAELIYAYLNFGHIPWANLRVGQFKEPFSYEVLYPEKFLDFLERSNVGRSVAPAEDIGVMAHNLGNPYAGWVEYGLGLFNGDGIHPNNEGNDDWEVAGRIAALPFANGPDGLKKFKVALNTTYSGEQHRDYGFRPRTTEGFEFFPRVPVDGKRLRWGGDLQWYYGPFSMKAEYIWAAEGRSGDLPDLITDGWHVDGTWVISGEEKQLAMERGWELAARYQEMRVDAQQAFAVPGYVDEAGNPVFVTDNRVRSLTLGLNKYINYNIKFQLNVERSWFSNRLLTPTSREGGVLSPGDDTVDKIMARLQLFF